MLILTRKTNQKIRIGSNIFVTICKIQGDQVSVGIEAPSEYKIARLELLPPEEQGQEPPG